ncbi:speedy protein 1-A-like [Rhinoderma darwinii]|uniref:speedy protein 1-A-like n=1 Tax=Rhinoderma darwinii TaxID=43563 RepID=UPI003F66DBD4
MKKTISWCQSANALSRDKTGFFFSDQSDSGLFVIDYWIQFSVLGDSPPTASEERRDDMSSRFPGRGGETARKRKRELIALYEEETSPSAVQEETQKRRKDDLTQQQEEMAAFFSLLEDEHIRLFLARDSCMKISDKYLLAMVLEYFRRAGLSTKEYRKNFFPALFLANQFEEEEDDYRQEIYPWALGQKWTLKRERLLRKRSQLLLRIGFRAWVDRATCDLIMAQDPLHWAWKRQRQYHHSWAVHYFRRDKFTINGPWSIPPSCSLCETSLLHPCKGKLYRTDNKEEPDTADL